VFLGVYLTLLGDVLLSKVLVVAAVAVIVGVAFGLYFLASMFAERQVPASSPASSEVSSPETSLLPTPPPGNLEPVMLHFRVEKGTVHVGITLQNTYPKEVIIEKVFLNDTLVYEGPKVIDPWGFLVKTFGSQNAEMMSTIYFDSGIPGREGIEASGERVYVGTITIHYEIVGVKGIYTKTLKLYIPKTMMKR